jgi:cell division protein FtsB
VEILGMDGKARMARFFSQLLMILVGIVVVYLVMDFGRQVVASRRLNEDLKESQARLDKVYEEQRELEDRVRYAYSVEAVDDWRRMHGLVNENEVAVIIVDYDEAPEAPETPVREKPRTTPASIPARRVWWDLFFAEQ